MAEVILAIAMLCNVKPIKLMSASAVDAYQLKCQQEYLDCVAEKHRTNRRFGAALGMCVLLRKVEVTK